MKINGNYCSIPRHRLNRQKTFDDRRRDVLYVQMRMLKPLKQITDDLMKKDKKEIGGKLTILDDLMEVMTNNPIHLEVRQPYM